MRETLWHGDTDSNIALETDYALLATWPDELKRSRLARVPNRWAQALLSRLLMRDPAARPPSVRAALRHPFFDEQRAHAAPPLAPSGQTGSSSPQHHFFLSHFQGNGGPRAMAIKFAVLNAVPDARIWFDQARETALLTTQSLLCNHQMDLPRDLRISCATSLFC